MAKMNNSGKQVLVKMQRKGNTVGGNANWCSYSVKTVWRFLKKLKRELPYSLAIALLGTYSKNTKILI